MSNVPGSYECKCADGWEGGGTNKKCDGLYLRVGAGERVCLITFPFPSYPLSVSLCFYVILRLNNFIDVDECAWTRCGGTSQCVNGQNKYSCNCSDGWEGGGDNNRCVDIDECDGIHCGGDSRCFNRVNHYFCDCASGWTMGGRDTVCVDIDDCKGVSCGGESKCKDLINAYRCDCAAGWDGGGINTSCSDINECASVDCGGVGSKCTDGLAKFFCQCADGFDGGGDNKVGVEWVRTDQCVRRKHATACKFELSQSHARMLALILILNLTRIDLCRHRRVQGSAVRRQIYVS